MSWLSNIAASAKSFGEAALSEAQDKASKLREKIEEELSSEYQRTTAPSMADAAVPPPPPPAQQSAPTALERVTRLYRVD